MPNCLGQKPLLLFQSGQWVGIICFDNTNETHDTYVIGLTYPSELIFGHKIMVWGKSKWCCLLVFRWKYSVEWRVPYHYIGKILPPFPDFAFFCKWNDLLKSNVFSYFFDFYAFPKVKYSLNTFMFCRRKTKSDEHGDVSITKVVKPIGMTTRTR